MAKKQQENFVLSLGGSLIAPKEGINPSFIRSFRDLVLKRAKRGSKFVVVCGGGATARAYQTAAASAAPTLSQDELDRVGIQATVLNARLMLAIFGKSAHGIITDPRVKLPAKTKVIIGAGWEPGCSTDYDALLLAEMIGAGTVINFSNIAYVYDRDPRKFPDAKALKSMTWKQFRQLFGSRWSPGLNSPFDPIAAKAAERAGIRVIIADGRDLANIGRILDGKPFIGTVIS
ncbi:MAG: UMP kinase [Patescibacteria group bacterium]|jgi:uridylate kinase